MTLAGAFDDKARTKGKTLSLCWNNVQIGTFDIAGHSLNWRGYSKPEYAELFNKRESDGMPYFLVNLHPENELYDLLKQDDQVAYIRNGLRFLCNLTISQDGPYDNFVRKDVLLAPMDSFVGDSTFNGTYDGPMRADLGDQPAEILKEFWRNRYVPRFSGKEIKIPATLDAEGKVTPAVSTSFTHMIKLPTVGSKESWGFNEWMSLELSEAAGLKTAKHALFPMGKNAAPAVLVERFDIPTQNDSYDKWLVIQDFCTLAGLGPDDRSSGSVEQIAKVVRQYSTDATADLEDLYKRTILSIAINDGDMHRKNISMLFEYSPAEGRYTNVRLTPQYDITSEIWQYDSEQTQVLSIQGKRAAFKEKTLVDLGKALGLTEERARDMLRTTLTNIAERAVEIANAMPYEAARDQNCRFAAVRIATLAVKSAVKFGADAPAWTAVEAPKTIVQTIGGEKHLKLAPH